MMKRTKASDMEKILIKEFRDSFVTHFYDSLGREVYEDPGGDDLIMMWTVGEDLRGDIRLETNETLHEAIFIRVMK